MKFFRLSEKKQQLDAFRVKGNERGLDCGLYALNELFSLKKGYPLFIAGAPYSGKTEFALEMQVNASMLYGWKHFLYVGEGGDVENVFAEILHKYTGKPFVNSNVFAMSDSELLAAEMWVDEHFVIANHDEDFTMDGFYKAVTEAEDQYGIRFDTTLFDPFNDIKDETELFGGREDKYLAHALKHCRISSKKHQRIDILVNHIADVRAMIDKDTGIRYIPPALPNEWAGGRTWWRRGFSMILLWRPTLGLRDDTGRPYEANETVFISQKSKPKGVGKIGHASIYYDFKCNRYYCRNERGDKLYSCQKPEPIAFKPIQQYVDFTESNAIRNHQEAWEDKL